jgi:hypothetical protein
MTLYPCSARSPSTVSLNWGYLTRGQSIPGGNISRAGKSRLRVERYL